MSEKQPEINVTIVRRREITTWPKIGVPVVNVLVTYVAADLPPATISIPKKEYTTKKEKEQIRLDVQSRKKLSPESYKV